MELVQVLILFCAALLLGCEAQVAFEIRPYPSGASRNAGCYLKDHNNKYLAFGEVWSVPGECSAISCERSIALPDGTPAFQLQFMGCGMQAVMRPCWSTDFRTGPYPKCCPRIQCPDADGDLESNSINDI
ncbi:unnamed protein product [Notodromas monacha]|uniref:Single domain-containing protein n=1 Tax=Notodromas monacha TaxID=399045 RepID=A0A7R9BZ52_9CRUS|nr:unnamed protein product [Notodromas monacha]CAG0922999.1 unnamed protein product [Notodromas monacha]